MNRIIGALAAIGLAAAIVIHAQTFFPQVKGVTSASPVFMLMHVGIFAVFIPFVLTQRSEWGVGRMSWGQMRALFPLWAQIVIAIVMAYTFVNFLLFTSTIGGTPELRDGQYVLMDHGKLVRTLTAEDYDLARAKITRGFSGHWMLFYLVPMLYFLFGNEKPPARQAPL